MLDDGAGTKAGVVVVLATRVANASPTGAALAVALAYVVIRGVRRFERYTGRGP